MMVLIGMVELSIVIVGMVIMKVVDLVIIHLSGMALASKKERFLGALGFLVMVGFQCRSFA